MIELDPPHMSVNDPRVMGQTFYGEAPRLFRMWNTWMIREDESREHIVTWVGAVARNAPGRRLRHLVLNCHGKPGHLLLGKGFGPEHISLLAAWRGLIDNIWLPVCLIARGGEGDVFCTRMARVTGAWVIGPEEIQCDPTGETGYGMMTDFEGQVFTFKPDYGTLSVRTDSMRIDANGRCVENHYTKWGDTPYYR